MSKTSKIATALLLVCSLVIGWYVILHDQPSEKLASARILNFEEYCAKNKLECSIHGTGSTVTYTAVNPWFQAKGENYEFQLGWERSHSSSSGYTGHYDSTGTVTRSRPSLSFNWDVAQSIRNLDLKERQR